MLVSGQGEMTAVDGQLLLTVDGTPTARLAFCRPDYVLVRPERWAECGAREVRARTAGRVDWLPFGGRLARYEDGSAVPAPKASGPARTWQPFDPLHPWVRVPRT